MPQAKCQKVERNQSRRWHIFATSGPTAKGKVYDTHTDIICSSSNFP